MTLKLLILSYDNPFFNPTMFLKYPDTLDLDALEQVPFLMQQYEKGFFIHNIGNLTTANLLFTVPSKYSRDKEEKLMISLVVEDPVKFNSSLANKTLEKFVEELSEIKNVYKAFYADSKIHSGDKSKVLDIRALMSKIHRTIPEDKIVFERKDAKVLIFGLSMAGKTTVIKCRRKSISKNTDN